MLILNWHRVQSLRLLAPEPRAVAPTATSRPTSTPEAAGPSAKPLLTSNLYARPDRSADIVAVLPADQRAMPDGRSADGDWVHLVYPPGSGAGGWTRASAVQFERIEATALPVLAVVAPTQVASGTPTPGRADPALADVSLRGSKLTVTVRNLGGVPLNEATMTLDVTKAEGDLVGQLTIGPTSLAAGASATVVTPLVIASPGSYRIVLAAAAGAEDAVASNNTRQVLLIPSVD